MMTTIFKKSKYVLLIFCFCLHEYSNAQSVNQMINFPSPNAMSLGLYGEVPVSLFTGKPKIEIPFYEVKCGELRLPISLSYNSAAVRPNAHPGWVGMGWALNAGGLITRKIKGVPDEYYIKENRSSILGHSTLEFDYGYYYNHDKLDRTDWNTKNYVEQLAKGENYKMYQNKVGEWKDTEPDEFIFNFNGYTGKFYFNEKGKIEVISKYDLKIEVNKNFMDLRMPSPESFLIYKNVFIFPTIKQITGFRITTPDGVKYEFGAWSVTRENTLAIEYSNNFFQQFFFINFDTWKLVRIESPNGKDWIKLSYQQCEPIASFGKRTTLHRQEGKKDKSIGFFNIFSPARASIFNVNTHYTGKIIMPAYLKKIITRNEEIHFTTSVTKEKKYNYWDILTDLFYISKNSYNCNLFNAEYIKFKLYNNRWFYSGRAQIIGPITPKFTVFDINNPYDMGCYMVGELGLFSRIDISETYYGYYIYDCEYVDFAKLKWRQLDRIDIKKAGDQKTIKSIKFNYTSNSNERLRLLSVQKIGKDESNTTPPYTFEYEDYETRDYPGDSKLPDYNSFSTDHWGYYSGVKEKSFLFKDKGGNWYSDEALNSYKAKRHANPLYMYAGVLTRMHYPTGGYTKFIYEPHKYTKIVSRDKNTGVFSLTPVASTTAGGVRIKKIQHYTKNFNLAYKKTYEYELGILTGDIQYYWKDYKGKLVSGDDYTADRFVSQSIIPVSSNSTGCHIGYSKVTEKMAGKGKTVFYYQNFQDHPDIGNTKHLDETPDATIDVHKTTYSPFTSKEIERGQLKEIHTYKENSGNYVLVRKEKNTFSQNPHRQNEYIPAISTRQIPVLGGVALEGTAYKVYTYPYNLDKKIIYNYEKTGTTNPLIQTKEYGYNYYNLVNSITTSHSDGSTFTKQYKYPTDYNYYYSIGPSNNEGWALKNMKALNILSTPIEQINMKNNKVISGKIKTYEYKNDEIILLKSIRNLNTPEPLAINCGNPDDFCESYNPRPDQGDFFTFDNHYKSNIEFDLYDDHGNLLQYHNHNNLYTSHIWGYNNTYPIAKVENAEYTDIFHTSFENSDHPNVKEVIDAKTGRKVCEIPPSAFWPENIEKGSISHNRKYIFQGAFKTSNNFTGSAAMVIKVWGMAGELMAWLPVYISNTQGEWKIYQREINTNDYPGLGWLELEIYNPGGNEAVLVDEVRFHPADAQMATYTYDPLIGMTSETDPNNQTTYYEYDGLGRLQYIKDKEKNIVEKYDYHYANQEEIEIYNCENVTAQIEDDTRYTYRVRFWVTGLDEGTGCYCKIDYGDGSPIEDIGNAPQTHEYPNDNTYTATFNFYNANDQLVKTIDKEVTPPVYFTAEVENHAYYIHRVNFWVTGIDEETGCYCKIDYGDGSPVENIGTSPQHHIYPDDNTYTATFNFYNAYNQLVSTITKQVTPRQMKTRLFLKSLKSPMI